MSKANPRKAIAALVPMTRHLRHGVVIRPMTLAMYAALERIKSPLVTGETPKDLMELVPSLYLITHDPRDLYRTPNLLDLAMAWADSLPVTVVEEIRRAAEESMREATAVIPEMDEEDAKKKTDGWISCLLNWCASTYHWSFEDIFHGVPLATICLLWRQGYVAANKIYPLQVIEEIDDGERPQSKA